MDRTIEPRLNQIFVPLLSIIEDRQAREDLRALARRYNRELIADRGMDMEAQILQIIHDILDASSDGRLPFKDITSWFVDKHSEDYDKKVTAKWIGSVIRKKLHLKTQKSHGIFIIAPSEASRLDRLYEKYGISSSDPDTPDVETDNSDLQK